MLENDDDILFLNAQNSQKSIQHTNLLWFHEKAFNNDVLEFWNSQLWWMRSGVRCSLVNVFVDLCITNATNLSFFANFAKPRGTYSLLLHGSFRANTRLASTFFFLLHCAIGDKHWSHLNEFYLFEFLFIQLSFSTHVWWKQYHEFFDRFLTINSISLRGCFLLHRKNIFTKNKTSDTVLNCNFI